MSARRNPTRPAPAEPAAQAVLDRLASLREARGHWLPSWRELAAQIMPRKGLVLPGQGQQPADEAVFDSTPAHSLELLASALGGLLTNPALPWFDLRLGRGAPDNDEVRAFLADCRERLLSLFNTEATGFQACVHELYLDLCLFGTAVLSVEADPDCLARFSVRPLFETHLAEDARGMVDTVIRTYSLSARQVLEQWEATCPPEVRRRAQEEPEARVNLIHAVFPRPERDPASPASAHFPYACVFVEQDSGALLEESGYHEMPYMCPRWAKVSGEAYGRGPGLTALSDVRVLNAMSRTALMAAEKMSDPPLMVPDDGFLGPVRSGPGGLSYYRAGSQDRIEALPVRVDLSAIEAMIERRRQSIRRIFLADQLAPEAVNSTATEALIRQAEKMRILGPVLGRLQTEFLAPLIERAFNILLREGELPPWPKDLPQGSLRVDYASPVAQAQRQAEAENLAQAVRYLQPLLGGGDPFSIMDNFEPDAMARHAATLFGLPPEYLRPQDRVAAIRAARQEAAMQAHTPAPAAARRTTAK
ncbi:Bacteriophage head to tail connecting protein [Humidesulfovibrio mexicanus]|uniref:Bacteriophage head to tail connecting protein n=1 Tax=Humidesulfovibrio mexicanus TaxID=147047 RepID=A0A239BXW2_9BACT|nr:portal protein [Humidesulfovibrio mexicanus]SNS12730.1 Bacteriophage head to tail connecting protein [Humidesulfovibrio mexicanus]